MSRPSVLFTVVDGLATITVNRPEARNSLTDDAARQIYDAVLAASTDPDIRVLVLRGQRRDFCCGADINQYVATRSGERQRLPDDVSHFQVPVLLREMPAVTIAAIRGGCAGAGLGWAAACDIRVAAPSARFNSAFLAVGAAGDMGGPWTLSRLIGEGRARDLYFFPRKFDAAEALAMGFVSRMLPDESFDDDLAALTAELLGRAPLALKGMKANFNAAGRLDLGAFVELETRRHAELFATRDRAEAFAAYVEKRSPRFEGY